MGTRKEKTLMRIEKSRQVTHLLAEILKVRACKMKSNDYLLTCFILLQEGQCILCEMLAYFTSSFIGQSSFHSSGSAKA
jgi:hypothetical protein